MRLILSMMILGFLLLGCYNGLRPNPCAYDKIEIGMSTSEVEAILGAPDRISSDWLASGLALGSMVSGRVIADKTYEYHCESIFIFIRFESGKVVNIEKG